MARYLVTGVAGFIGRSIAAALLARRAKVCAASIVSLRGKRTNLKGLEAMEFIEGDLANPDVCVRACAGIEIVFHEGGAWHRFLVRWPIRWART